MADWNEIAVDGLRAAQMLGEAGRHRSCASRAYYAAFSAVSFALQPRAPFERQRETPPHHRVISLVQDQFRGRWPAPRMRSVKAMLRRLYNNRINADYRSGVAVDHAVALESRRDAHAICRCVGVDPDAAA